jgi:predicted  nucleic acid-binding Zn-ribbon protein
MYKKTAGRMSNATTTNEANRASKAEVALLRKELEEAKAAVEEATKNSSALEAEKKRLQEELAARDKEVKDLDEEKKKNQALVENLQKLCARYKGIIDTKDKETTIRREKAKFDEKIEAFKSEAMQKDAKIKTLTEQLERLKAVCTDRQRKLRAFEELMVMGELTDALKEAIVSLSYSCFDSKDSQDRIMAAMAGKKPCLKHVVDEQNLSWRTMKGPLYGGHLDGVKTVFYNCDLLMWERGKKGAHPDLAVFDLDYVEETLWPAFAKKVARGADPWTQQYCESRTVRDRALYFFEQKQKKTQASFSRRLNDPFYKPPRRARANSV